MEDQIAKALNCFERGELVSMPTETVYGLAAPIDNKSLLRKIFELKERPYFDPLIIHVNNTSQCKELVNDWPAKAQKLADAFWPGPLTIVLKRNAQKVDDLITAGLETVALRCSSHPLAQKLIFACGTPIAAPSANKFTKVSPTNAAHVREAFPDLFVIDGGDCQIGIESTIVSIVNDKVQILRPGIISKSEIENLLEIDVTSNDKKPIQMPGSHHIHYRPAFPLAIGYKNIDQSLINEIFRGLDIQGKKAETIEVRTLNITPTLAARELYSLLRLPLKEESEVCYFQLHSSSKDDDRWDGIINRLKRASTLDLLLW